MTHDPRSRYVKSTLPYTYCPACLLYILKTLPELPSRDAPGIEDDPNNFTRFILLRVHPVSLPPGVPCKTSIVFSLDNIAGRIVSLHQSDVMKSFCRFQIFDLTFWSPPSTGGALFKALSVFALREIDLSKIESRPCKTERVFRGSYGIAWWQRITVAYFEGYTSSHNHGSQKWVPPTVATFQM